MNEIETLVKELKSDSSDIWCNARGELLDIGREEPDAVAEAVIRVLDDKSHEIRDRAVHVLGLLGSEKAIPHLLKLLKNKTIDGSNAGWALSRIGEPAVDQLIEIAQDVKKDTRSRVNAIFALRNMKSVKAIDILMRMLDDGEIAVRVNAADALIAIGEPTIGRLIKIFAYDSVYVRFQVVRVLKEIIKEIKTIERLDEISISLKQVVEGNKERDFYRKMKRTASEILALVNKRKNELLSVDIRIENRTFKRPEDKQDDTFRKRQQILRAA